LRTSSAVRSVILVTSVSLRKLSRAPGRQVLMRTEYLKLEVQE
jgi:hypothetical protein